MGEGISVGVPYKISFNLLVNGPKWIGPMWSMLDVQPQARQCVTYFCEIKFTYYVKIV